MSEWIKYTGGGCPVPEGTKLRVELHNGHKNSHRADFFSWTPNTPNSIKLYQVIEEANEWIQWTVGKDCSPCDPPVTKSTLVEVILKGDEQPRRGLADDFYWAHCMKPILRYRIVSATPMCESKKTPMHELYPAYYRDVSKLVSIDTYAINRLFPVDDPSGCVIHSRKKLLLAGSRTGGKEFKKDIKEARDTLSRLIELWEEDSQT